MTTNNFVTIGSTRDQISGKVFKACLEDHGIECLAQGDNHRSQLGLLGPYIEIRFMVPEDKAEDAKKLYDEFFEQNETPSSDHSDLKKRNKQGIAIIFSIMFTFGTGHLYAGSFYTFLILLSIELAAIISQMYFINKFSSLIVLGVVLYDLIGSFIKIRKQNLENK
ncbi:DUF2007 domain-containing protein [bacterium]|nr:DUF2007 domain-containing protein [bacterium]